MELLDLTIVLAYFVFVIFAALVFKRFAKTSSGFIRGGGAMMWWMAGATAFMTQFSAWTFTGAAAKAYEDGLTVLFLFWGNALGFFVAALYFAERYRKLRVDTPMEVIKLRFGKVSEQFYTWLSFPLGILSAAIWLNGLAIFVAAVFGIDLYVTIMIVGALVTFVAVSGGSWTVSATNVIQLILLVSITMTVGGFALYSSGGPTQMVENYPGDFLLGSDIQYWQICAIWVFIIMGKQTINTNNALTCYRFLVTTNEKEAKKAALVAGILFVVGPVMWFIPPWVTAGLGVNLQSIYPNLGESANNAAYVYYIDYFMPKGILGLVLAAMIAATVAPMTTALNRNAGIFVRNVYQSVINQNASERQQMKMGKIATLVSGLLSVGAALLFASIREYSFFDLMMLFGALLQMPLSIPSLLALVVMRTPDWSGWATIVVGLCVSAFMHFIFEVNWLLPLFNAEAFTHREYVDLTVVCALVAQIVITGGFFVATRLFYKEREGQRATEFNAMMANLTTPISSKEEAEVDRRQGKYLGRMSQILGIFIVGIGVWFESWTDKGVFIIIGCLIFLAGCHLYRSRKAPELVVS
ncbi:transporter [Vibrio breoganii]|uniref:sodium:solute symporter family transporter n=1 Tax=Vibrio breoganii TaxID=553239 RepID=UPI000C8261B3|nr:transporter [Vibrio breoganii]PMG95267.1 transporter [Vibrio breoganii]TKG25050.1 transporter [Vibrio breoganii]